MPPITNLNIASTMTTESITHYKTRTKLSPSARQVAGVAQERVAFPNDFERKNSLLLCMPLLAMQDKEQLEGQKIPVAVAGRMMLKRVMARPVSPHFRI